METQQYGKINHDDTRDMYWVKTVVQNKKNEAVAYVAISDEYLEIFAEGNSSNDKIIELVRGAINIIKQGVADLFFENSPHYYAYASTEEGKEILKRFLKDQENPMADMQTM